MSSDDIRLGSVNWEHGMLLTPEHFLRQERYFESRLLWLLRYTANCYGLIGGGPRLQEAERGAKGDDPVVNIFDDAESLSITVAQCRGVTPGGCMVEIGQDHPVALRVSRSELEGVADSRIYVLCSPHGKVLADSVADGLNQQAEQEWLPVYRVALRVDADQVPYALAVGRIVRARDGVDFDRDPHFIPACTFIDAHSELAASAREIQGDIIRLAARFTELHRAMSELLPLVKERGIETENDLDSMAFVGRMLVALQNSVYEIMDTNQDPQSFFGHLRRFFHSAAVYLDLSQPVRQYFDQLKEIGETEFIAPIAQQKKALAGSPKWRIHQDLSDEVTSALQSIEALQKLERALEGKYIDFRFNPLLESMKFIFDREGQVLYMFHAKSNRFQGPKEGRTIVFAKLQLEGREKFRLVLVGEDDAVFSGDIFCELHINENTGTRSKPRNLKCSPKPDQCNFDFDFDAPEVPLISDLQVTLTTDHPIKVGMLFVRRRLYAEQPDNNKARPLQRDDRPPRIDPSRPEPTVRGVSSDRDRGDTRRLRNDVGETSSAARDRDAPLRSDREAPRYARDSDPPRRVTREYEREAPRRGEWDGSERLRDAPRDTSRDDDRRSDDEEPPPAPRRKRFQD